MLSGERLQKKMEAMGIVAMEASGQFTENIAWAAIKAMEDMDAQTDAQRDAQIICEMQRKKECDLEAVIDGR
jgi:hypothetical protein